MQVFVRPDLTTSCLRALARLWVLSCSAVSVYLFVRPGVATYVFVHPSEASLFACPGEATGSNMSWTQGPCQAARSNHAGVSRHCILQMDRRKHCDPLFTDATQFHAMVRTALMVDGTERNEDETVTPCSNQMSLATCSGDLAEVLGSARG